MGKIVFHSEEKGIRIDIWPNKVSDLQDHIFKSF